MQAARSARRTTVKELALRGKAVVAVLAAYCGPAADGAPWIDRLRSLGGALIDRAAARRGDADAVAVHARRVLDEITEADGHADDH